MDLTTQINKVTHAIKNGARYIAPSDAQGIFEAAYGPMQNWPQPEPAERNHYHIDDVKTAISVVRKQAQQIAEAPAPEPPEAEAEQTMTGRIDTSSLPSYAQYSLLEAGFRTFEDLRKAIDDGVDLTQYRSIGQATVERIRRELGYPTESETDDSAPAADPVAQEA